MLHSDVLVNIPLGLDSSEDYAMVLAVGDRKHKKLEVLSDKFSIIPDNTGAEANLQLLDTNHQVVLD